MSLLYALCQVNNKNSQTHELPVWVRCDFEGRVNRRERLFDSGGSLYRVGADTRKPKERWVVRPQKGREDSGFETVPGEEYSGVGGGFPPGRRAGTGWAGEAPGRRVQSTTCSDSVSMPKTASRGKTGKEAARPKAKREKPIDNGRLKAMVGLVQGVEDKTHHNRAAAMKARNLMNAVGVILQELPALLKALNAEKDRFSYKLYDLGTQGIELYSNSLSLIGGMKVEMPRQGEGGG